MSSETVAEAENSFRSILDGEGVSCLVRFGEMLDILWHAKSIHHCRIDAKHLVRTFESRSWNTSSLVEAYISDRCSQRHGLSNSQETNPLLDARRFDPSTDAERIRRDILITIFRTVVCLGIERRRLVL